MKSASRRGYGVSGGSGPGLLLKPAQAVFVVGEIGGQDFESDLAVEAGGFGEVDLSHATLSELAEDAR